jgi:hypothetical protein
MANFHLDGKICLTGFPIYVKFTGVECLRMEAVELSGKSIFGVLAVSSRGPLVLLAVDSTRASAASRIAWPELTVCFPNR